MPHTADATHADAKHVHNDLEQHSPLYMLMCFFMVAAAGFGLWYTFLRDLTG